MITPEINTKYINIRVSADVHKRLGIAARIYETNIQDLATKYLDQRLRMSRKLAMELEKELSK